MMSNNKFREHFQTVSLTADPPLLDKNGIIEKYKTAYRTKQKRRSTSMVPADIDETVDCLITSMDII